MRSTTYSLLHHAAAEADEHFGVSTLVIFQRPYIAEYSVFSVFPHRTGIVDDEISVFWSIGKTVADIGENTLDLFSVADVLLTPVRVYIS